MDHWGGPVLPKVPQSTPTSVLDGWAGWTVGSPMILLWACNVCVLRGGRAWKLNTQKRCECMFGLWCRVVLVFDGACVWSSCCASPSCEVVVFDSHSFLHSSHVFV